MSMSPMRNIVFVAFFENEKNLKRLSLTVLMIKKSQKTFWVFYEKKPYKCNVNFIATTCAVLWLPIYKVHNTSWSDIDYRVNSNLLVDGVFVRYWTIWLMYVHVFTKEKKFEKKNRMKHVVFIIRLCRRIG